MRLLFLLYRRSRVFLWVATAHMACLLLDEVNGSLYLNGLLRCILLVLKESS